MKLTHENYHSIPANDEFMGSTQLKGYIECESKAEAKRKGQFIEPPAIALMCGSYFHSWNDSTSAYKKYLEDHPEMIASSGKNKGGLKSDYQCVPRAIELVSKDETFMSVISGEKEVILTAEMFGIPWKICIDSYNPELKQFADLKLLKSLDDKQWNKELNMYEHVLVYRGYLSQIALYAEIERLAMGRKENDYYTPYIAIATKDPVPDKAIIGFDNPVEPLNVFLAFQLRMIGNKIERIKKVRAGEVTPGRCEVCDWCKKTKVLEGYNHYSDYTEIYGKGA